MIYRVGLDRCTPLLGVVAGFAFIFPLRAWGLADNDVHSLTTIISNFKLDLTSQRKREGSLLGGEVI